MTRKSIRQILSAFAMVGALSLVGAQQAQANLIQTDPVEVPDTGTGLGAVLTILTLESNGGNNGGPTDIKTGGVGWDGTQDFFINEPDLNSANSETYAISDLNGGDPVMGDEFVIIWNPNEAGPSSSRTDVNTLIVTIYDDVTGDVLISASLAAPVTFPLNQGIGSSGFGFTLDDAMALAFTPFLVDLDNRIGLEAEASYVDNGQDSFFIQFVEGGDVPPPPPPGEVPEPTTLVLFGVGLLGLGYMIRRRRQSY